MNREKFKSIMHSNRFLECLLKIERRIQYYYYPTLSFYIYKLIRKYSNNSLHSRIRLLKNKYKGERCFIICTGPSLTKEDLFAISNEYTFGMNSVALMDDWKPRFYGVQDYFVLEKIINSVKQISKESITFLPYTLCKKFNMKMDNSNIIPVNIFGFDHLVNPYSKRFKFSEDCFEQVNDGFSITISLIQIAFYLGFREIYLIGADSTYKKGGRNHFIEHGTEDPFADIAGRRLIRYYKYVKKFADGHDLKIYNATRGGMLEVFERVNLEDIKLK